MIQSTDWGYTGVQDMSAKLELRWLKLDKTKGPARLFAEFCKEDIQTQSKLDDFNLDKYQDAVRLIIRKLDNSHSLKKIFTDKEQLENKVAEEKKQ